MQVALNMVVFNEENRIQETLTRASQWVEEIVIVDQESTDRTVAFIEEWAHLNNRQVKVVPDYHYGFCEPSRETAWKHTESDWILVLDADEHISDEFGWEMPAIEGNYWGARLKRSLWLNGMHRFTGDFQFRFFHKSKVQFLSELHVDPQVFGCYPELIYSPQYVGIFHRKSWTEQLRDEEAYEQLIFKNETGEAAQRKLALNVHLKLARELGLSAAELDALTIEQQRELGIAGMDFTG